MQNHYRFDGQCYLKITFEQAKTLLLDARVHLRYKHGGPMIDPGGPERWRERTDEFKYMYSIFDFYIPVDDPDCGTMY